MELFLNFVGNGKWMKDLQWQVECEQGGDSGGVGDYDANLCISKCQLCQISTKVPRSELCGALLVSRLMLVVELAFYKMEETLGLVVSTRKVPVFCLPQGT